MICFFLSSRDLDVLRAQRIMGFFILITHKSMRSENGITWIPCYFLTVVTKLDTPKSDLQRKDWNRVVSLRARLVRASVRVSDYG